METSRDMELAGPCADGFSGFRADDIERPVVCIRTIFFDARERTEFTVQYADVRIIDLQFFLCCVCKAAKFLEWHLEKFGNFGFGKLRLIDKLSMLFWGVSRRAVRGKIFSFVGLF